MPTREEIEAQARAGDAFRQTWWGNITALPQAAKDFLGRFVPNPSPITAPETQTAEPQATAPAPEAAAAAAAAPTEPGKTPTTLDDFRSERDRTRAALAAADAIAKDENQPPDVRVRAQATATTLRQLETSQTTQIAAEENRLRDEAAAKKKEDEAKAKEAEGKPKNGDERWVPIETKDEQGRTVRGVGQEIYTNGVWKYQPGSAKADTGFGSGPQGPGTPRNLSLQKDGKGNYYTFDPASGKVERVSGIAGEGEKFEIVQVGGETWLAGPDGKPRERLSEAKPTSATVDNTLVLTDPMTGKVITRVDLLDPTQRERANRLAELSIQTAEQGLQPKFASATAQYAQEAQRRQALARTELSRLLKLQEEGQISPETAQTQFDRWMQINVEGPLAGYQRAAQEEEEAKRQADLTRQRAEDTRVEEYNLRRGQLAAAAGEAGRSEAIELGKATRAPEFISDLGGLAQSLSQGKTDFQFSPGSFDVANYRKAVPNVQELADAAVERLLSRIGGPATARDVNAPRAGLPTGQDLMGLMDGVKYSGPLSAAPQNEQPLPGQGAVDLEGQGRPGYARSVYSNGRYLDWQIPQIGGAVPTPAIPGY